MEIRREITVFHLHMTDPGDLRPSQREVTDLQIIQAKIPSPEFNRFLYTAVGGDWHWHDRLQWDYRGWLDYLDRPDLETWVAYVAGTPAGYVELEDQCENGVEIAYFGIIPQFIGRGIGGLLLTTAIRRAWQMTDVRVWVHTCTLDHPHALANYEARGMRIAREEIKHFHLLEEAPGPWPGANRLRQPID